MPKGQNKIYNRACTFGFRRFLRSRRMTAYSMRALNTRKMQMTRYMSMAFTREEIGALSLEGEKIIILSAL